MSQQSGRFFNATLNFNELSVTTSTNTDAQHQSHLAVLVSTDAVSGCNVVGVKSDRGTTDGYLALPLTTKSTEFFIAAWPSVPYWHLRHTSVFRWPRLALYVM